MGDVFTGVPKRALAVYAHPDDPDISCGATLAVWAAQGCEVHVVVCTRGEKGSADPAVDVDALAARRAAEMDAAGRILGVRGRRHLGIDDGELSVGAELRALVVAAIRDVRPEVVLCPDPTAVFFGDTYYNHADHRVAGWVALDAVSPAAGNPHYFPEQGRAHSVRSVFMSGTLEPNLWVDVSQTLETKIAAVLCHRSQMAGIDTDRIDPEPAPDGLTRPGVDHAGGTGEWFAAALRQRAADEGQAAGVAYAEGFRRLRL